MSADFILTTSVLLWQANSEESANDFAEMSRILRYSLVRLKGMAIQNMRSLTLAACGELASLLRDNAQEVLLLGSFAKSHERALSFSESF